MASIKISIRRKSAPAPTLPPGIWAQALHDYERPENLREDLGYSVPRSLLDPKDKLDDAKGFPEMVPLSPRIGVKLTKPLQWFWVKQLVLSKYGVEIADRPMITIEEDFTLKLSAAQRSYIRMAWAGLTKGHTAFMNGAGTDTRRDYIRHINLDGEFPILFENTCGGSLLRLSSATPYSVGYKVLTLSPGRFNEWKDWRFYEHPEYFAKAVNSTPYGFDGSLSISGPWRVDPFHYLGGAEVPIPLLSDLGFVYIRKDRLRLLQEGEPFPPRAYNP